MTHRHERILNIGALARVEGEGAMYVRVGGFHQVPSPRELRGLVTRLGRALDDALATARWVAGFDFPDLTFDHELLALTGEEYPLERGTPRTTTGAAFEVADFEDEIEEHHVPNSTARHFRLVHGGRYLTGPLARFALNRDRLSPLAHEAAADAGLGPQCRNPFQSIVVRAVEIVHAIEEDLRRLVRDRLDFDDEALTSACERTIRSYDPCVSCTAHFLDLKVVRS
ncbi:hypothetical protein GCM10023195_74540 [Actinoallomurus liliacearum]|uniref:Ni/Fe hydrogenase subunit alpha n=1 Tax=Actinoallomurus liliacearum TaxID=1080073 RepID=A0ABP8TUU8_9ACTN